MKKITLFLLVAIALFILPSNISASPLLIKEEPLEKNSSSTNQIKIEKNIKGKMLILALQKIKIHYCLKKNI